jgi:AraC-like DNA-binding protein
VAIFLPGDIADFVIDEGSLYIAASASEKRLATEAERHGLALHRGTFFRTAVHSRPMDPNVLESLRSRVLRLHESSSLDADDAETGRVVLEALIRHCAHFPNRCVVPDDPVGRARIVSKAHKYVCEHLKGPISLSELAAAVETSRRTLTRAFDEILEESPAAYIRRLRLHAIRRELVNDRRPRRGISEISAAWGINEPGRMAGWYREVFNERPSATFKTQQSRRRFGPAF